MTIENLYPTTRPSLNLNFARTKRLDPRVTFSRSSSGTYFDNTGLLRSAGTNQARFDHDPVTGESLGLLVEEARTNQSQYSEYFDNTYWTKSGIVTPNSAVFIDDKITASSLVASGSETDVRKNFALSVNTYYAFSVYAKKNSSKYCYLYALGHPFAYFVAVFDLDTGICTQQDTRNNNYYPLSTNYAINGVDVGNGYYRLTIISNTPTYASQTYGFGIAPQGTGNTLQGGGIPITGTVAGDSIYVGGAQLETGSFPTSYIPTPATFTSRSTTATYYDASGTIQTAGIDVARDNAYFPDSNGMFKPAGLLLEAAGTNLVLNSVNMNGTGWGRGNGTIALSAITSPDGVNASYSWTNTQTTGSYNYALITVTSSTQYTFSFWYKAGSGRTAPRISLYDATNAIFFDDGPSYNTTAFPNGWYRLSYAFTSPAASTAVRVYVDRNAQEIGTLYIWGVQVETGPFPTSYIPTSGSTVTRAADVSSSSTVTRSADVASMTGTNFSSWYNQSEGTITCNVITRCPLGGGNSTSNAGVSFALTDGSFNNRIYGSRPPEGSAQGDNFQPQVFSVGVAIMNPSLTDAWPANVLNKQAIAYKNNNFNYGVNGSTGSPVLSGNVPTGINRLDIGQVSFATYNRIKAGTFARLAYYPTRLPDAQLQELTR